MARLLIVEDDDSVRSFTARALAAAGYEIETAEDGLDGLEKIKKAQGAFDLVLSDIRMPAMDGIEMARTAAKVYPGLRLLLMTGFADQRERAVELDGTVAGVVNKPFSLAEIRERVGKVLAE
ncbi:response regulator [Chelativorans sp. SCAU2101]|jgi:Response regulator containing CheY-like receiver, AAA-type ATPase, and DNA-binding domains|uniref:Response regulator n=1 Tax=Chelativorans petroleitrophicus TaxID=2975484 RepID=A0A9X2X6A8_9HYPH|nr:response regulator [Chelativorans petroleitrophicus]MCT8989665.1 response regulator [Chelativorans petroleitrophicus]